MSHPTILLLCDKKEYQLKKVYYGDYGDEYLEKGNIFHLRLSVKFQYKTMQQVY
jgi:hypothetical protein